MLELIGAVVVIWIIVTFLNTHTCDSMEIARPGYFLSHTKLSLVDSLEA